MGGNMENDNLGHPYIYNCFIMIIYKMRVKLEYLGLQKNKNKIISSNSGGPWTQPWEPQTKATLSDVTTNVISNYPKYPSVHICTAEKTASWVHLVLTYIIFSLIRLGSVLFCCHGSFFWGGGGHACIHACQVQVDFLWSVLDCIHKPCSRAF